MNLTDTYKHQALREQMVAHLQSLGIRNRAVLNAMLLIPRHFFFDRAFVEKAYDNRAFPIGNGQTISQPFTVARQSELLSVTAGMKVLEVGTGSGYQAAVLASMGAEVYTLERHQALHEHASALLKVMQLNKVHCYYADGFEGLPQHSPFDRILITASAPAIPQKLLKQLCIGGSMVVPVQNKEGSQTMTIITRIDEEQFDTVEGNKYRFVPMLKGLE